MIIRLIITIIAVYFIVRLVRGLFLPSAGKEKSFPRKPASIPGEELVKDPQCGTYVPVSSATKATIDGQVLYFCSEECLKKYKEQKQTTA